MFVSEDGGERTYTDRKTARFQLKIAVSILHSETRQEHKAKVVLLNLDYEASCTNLRETSASTELVGFCATSSKISTILI